MTKQESILISAYTGNMICKSFSELHSFIEEKMERPVFTHELANNEFNSKLREILLQDIIKMIENIEETICKK